MIRQLLLAVLTLATATSVGLAQNSLQKKLKDAISPSAAGEPQEVKAAIDKHYPGAQQQVEGQQEENGVKIYDVKITPKDGQPFTAVVTEHGDFVTSGIDLGANPQNLPAAVRELTQDIWKTAPQDVRAVTGTFYSVTLAPAGGAAARAYSMRFDPTGRLVNVKSPGQQHHEAWQNLADAQGDADARMRQITMQRFPQAKIQAVKQQPDAPGFYQVRFQDNGGDAWIIADANATLSEEATTVPMAQLPKPIQDVIHSHFNGDTVVWSSRQDLHLYDVRETVGTETITLRIQADGEVWGVNATGRGGEAVPAAARLLHGK